LALHARFPRFAAYILRKRAHPPSTPRNDTHKTAQKKFLGTQTAEVGLVD
jgi:hypothetical protein